MPQPFNYNLDIKNPYEIAVTGMQTGVSIADAMRKKELATQELARSKQLSEHMNLLAANKNATAEDYAKLTMLLPKDQSESVQKAWGMLEKSRLDEEIGRKGTVLSALVSGNTELAIDKLNEYATAYRNAGKEGPARYYETWAKVAEQNPDAARINFGMMLSTMPGGDKIVEGVTKLAQSRREEELHDPESVERKRVLELEQLGVSLGLTKAQTTKAIIEGKKVSAETVKIMMELEQLKKTGGLDPAKRFEMEEKLRKEYTARIGGYTAMRQHQSTIDASAADTSGAGDIALVTSFMKMLDPGSVVRETEFANARDTAGLLQKLQNQAQKLQSGSFLDGKQRQDFKRLAAQYMAAAEKEQKRTKQSLELVVKDSGLKPENVFGVEPAPAEDQPSGSVAEPTTSPADIEAILNKYLPK